MTSRSSRFGFWIILVCAAVLPVAAQKNKPASKSVPPTITVSVDASDAPA